MRTIASALALLLALLAPIAAASGASPPLDATPVQAGSAIAYHWVGNETGYATPPEDGALDSVSPNASASVIVAALMDRQDTNASAIVWTVNVSATSLTFTPSNATLRKEYGNATTSEAYHFAQFNFTAPAQAGEQGYSLVLERYAETNGTLVLLGSAFANGTITVASAEVPVPPAAPGIPTTTWLLAGAAVLLVGGGALAYGLRQRNLKRRMQGERKRSQVMRELELEQKLQKAKDEEQVQEIKQEIRAQEVVREKRRELQILEAKRADALKTIDLLRKRHEGGGLTKLQYDNMVAKKQADLARIEAEIAQMEAEDAAGSGAAA